jgi:hypothetical protein
MNQSSVCVCVRMFEFKYIYKYIYYQNPNTFFGSIPKAVVMSIAELQATMCCLTTAAASSAELGSAHNFFRSQFLMVRALSIVSAVVNVLETMTTRVVSWSRSRTAREKSTGSTLARNYFKVILIKYYICVCNMLYCCCYIEYHNALHGIEKKRRQREVK